MRSVWLGLVVLVSVGCSSSSDDPGGGGATAGCPSTGTDPAALECKILELVNQTRAAGTTCQGQPQAPAPPVVMNSILRSAAQAHAKDMADNNYFAHKGLDGRSPFDRMKDAGYDYNKAGENIAAGSSAPEATMQQWLGSKEGHCEAIMDPGYEDLGVGYAYSPTNQYQHIWVQKFGRSK